MIQLSRFYQWIENRSNLFVDLVRIYLGIGLFVRGILFFDKPVLLSESLLSAGNYSDSANFLGHLIAVIHVGGGLMLAFGLATRIAALIQIPILFVAVFFVHFPEGLMTSGQSLEFSALVLFLLVILFIRGSGKLSLDSYFLDREPVPIPPLPPEEPRPPLAMEPIGLDATCSCGHGIDHYMVTAQPTFRKRAWFALFMGVRATPTMITYRCRECGEVIAKTRDPEILFRHR
jgi:uncharacterized membrane protein YphA (DoxX/SURF4 family)